VESGLDSRIGPDGKKAAETLKHLLDDVNALAAQGNAIAAGKTTESMQRILDSISQEVASLAARAQGHADTLADKVDADRDTVAKLEADARAHGIGIELSREELLGSLAEINQEITQPLSVASAVVQMLSNGTLGDVPDAQKDILKVATDGMERLDKLVKYLGRISGMPQNLSPDFSIINEAYGNKS
jgi:signal transduction histidine kinase